MFKYFANLFGYVLNFIYGLVGNYGIAIILFTIFLRILLLPVNLKQQKTMKKNAIIQAELKELQDKYSNDQVRLAEEMRNLYKKHNMSPFSGCLGSILQLVIVISMFILVSNPLTYMKKLSNEKIQDYTKQVKELHEKENLNYIEIAIIKEFGNKNEDVNLNMNLLGLDLSDVPSKNYNHPEVFIIPGLYIVTSLLNMKISMATADKNNKQKEEKTKLSPEENLKLAEEKQLIKKENEEADAMESMNKSMRYMMPIMTVSIALIAPLGLALYWFTSNLLMIIERLVVNVMVKKEEEKANG